MLNSLLLIQDNKNTQLYTAVKVLLRRELMVSHIFTFSIRVCDSQSPCQIATHYEEWKCLFWTVFIETLRPSLVTLVPEAYARISGSYKLEPRVSPAVCQRLVAGRNSGIMEFQFPI